MEDEALESYNILLGKLSEMRRLCRKALDNISNIDHRDDGNTMSLILGANSNLGDLILSSYECDNLIEELIDS